jgi:NADH-quinone oxidoreductase subunit L
MSQLLQFFIWVPLLGFTISLLLPRKDEKLISSLAIGTAGITLLGALTFITYWLLNGHPVLDVKQFVFYKAHDIEIFLNFYFDKITAVFLAVGSILAFLVTIFSRFYIHREGGFKRFMNNIIMFYIAFNVVILAGNFETLFTGWEILGICSFLLIGFYRDRYLPVRNSLKVISIYRLGDICLILAMWMSHHLWHENITFFKMSDAAAVSAVLQEHYWYGVFIAVMVLIAAAAKSAQLPFSSWLPRAMEGPTTSSAIFYGSLSVHLGVFLLLRTFPFWENMFSVKIIVIAVGLLTALIASGIAKVQSSVKTQIAYSSITQIGLIFIEVALGLHELALIHFAANAFLRTYQLLVSPSVLGYMIHDMFFNFNPAKQKVGHSFSDKIKNTIYVLSVKEWNLDFMLQRYLWTPFKWAGKAFGFISAKISVVLLILIFTCGVYLNIFPERISPSVFKSLPVVFSFLGLIIILKAFSEKGSAMKAWLFVIMGQLFITLTVALLSDNFGGLQVLIYLSGSMFFAVVGVICLQKIKSIDNNINLDIWHGYSFEQPRIGFVFLISCLGFAGLPFTPTFIGIDILFSNIHTHDPIVIILTALSFVFMEISVLRIYSRIFLGQHKKASHAMAYRSS